MGVLAGTVLDNSNPGSPLWQWWVLHIRLKVSEVWVQIYETSI